MTHESNAAQLEMLLEQMGETRLAVLQESIDRYSENGQVYSALNLIQQLVEDRDILEIATTADAIGEIGTSKSATRALLRGKMTLRRVLAAHTERAEEKERELDKEKVIREGTVGTETVSVDLPSSLHLVELILEPHLIYEGLSLKHCLRNPNSAKRYLADSSSRMYSLRQDGIKPVTTIEVRPSIGTIPQARGMKDVPINYSSQEYRVLASNLGTLASHSGSTHSILQITDRLRTI